MWTRVNGGMVWFPAEQTAQGFWVIAGSLPTKPEKIKINGYD